MAKKKEIIEEVEEIEVEEEQVYNDKEISQNEWLKRIFICLVVIAVILSVIAVAVLCNLGSNSKKNDSSDRNNSSSENSENGNSEEGTPMATNCYEDYDVSMMNEVDLNGVLKLFDDKKTYVLYIGRCNCGACMSYLPNLQKAQENYNFTIQYFDILSTDFTTAQAALADKLTYKYKMEEDGEEKNLTFGEWYGYTPMTIIIKNGKQVDGEIGYIEYEQLTKMLENNGIKKK